MGDLDGVLSEANKYKANVEHLAWLVDEWQKEQDIRDGKRCPVCECMKSPLARCQVCGDPLAEEKAHAIG